MLKIGLCCIASYWLVTEFLASVFVGTNASSMIFFAIDYYYGCNLLRAFVAKVVIEFWLSCLLLSLALSNLIKYFSSRLSRRTPVSAAGARWSAFWFYCANFCHFLRLPPPPESWRTFSGAIRDPGFPCLFRVWGALSGFGFFRRQTLRSANK